MPSTANSPNEKGKAFNPSEEDTATMIPATPPRSKRLKRLMVKLNGRLRGKNLFAELRRTSLAAGIMILSIIIMTMAQMFSDRWFDMYSRSLMIINSGGGPLIPIPPFNATMLTGQRVDENGPTFATDPLFDHVFAILPNKVDLRGWLPDLLLTSFVALSLIITLLFPAKTRIRFQSIIVGRRVMWTLSLLYIFRTASFLVTTVPSPQYQCVPKYPEDPSAYLLFIGKMATGKITACTDNIYSGHTALATVMLFMNINYSGRWYFGFYSLLHVGAILFTILLTRLHYSVDILIALFMTSFVWCTLHFLLLVGVGRRVQQNVGITKNQLMMMDNEQQPDEQQSLLFAEQRLILRLTNYTLIRILLWMDGLDLRIPTPPQPNTPTEPQV